VSDLKHIAELPGVAALPLDSLHKLCRTPRIRFVEALRDCDEEVGRLNYKYNDDTKQADKHIAFQDMKLRELGAEVEGLKQDRLDLHAACERHVAIEEALKAEVERLREENAKLRFDCDGYDKAVRLQTKALALAIPPGELGPLMRKAQAALAAHPDAEEGT